MAHRVIGIVLAGGRGQRFGVAKAEATLPDGRSFLAACADALTRAGVAPIIATLPPGHGASVPPGVRGLRLPDDGLAMLDALRLALAEALEGEAWRKAVIHPVDHPLVLPQTIRALLAALEASSADAALPSHAGKHGHPVAVRRGVCEAIVAVHSPFASLRDALHAATTVDVKVQDGGVVANCNTPEHLREALGRLALQG